MASGKKKKRIGILIAFCLIVTVIVAAVVYYVYRQCHSDKEKYRQAGITAMQSGSYGVAVNDFDLSLNEKQWFCEDMDLDTKMYKSACLIRLERYEEAENLLQALMKESSPALNNSLILSMIDMAHANSLVTRVTDEDAAPPIDYTIQQLEEAASKDSGLYLYLASAYNRRNEYGKERDALNEYLKDHPMNTYVAYELSTSYLNERNISEAERIIEQGLAAEDNVYKDLLQYNRVICLEYSGDYNGAFGLVEKLHEQYPDNEDMLREYTFLDSRVHPDDTPVNPYSDVYSEEEWEAIRRRLEGGQ